MSIYAQYQIRAGDEDQDSDLILHDTVSYARHVLVHIDEVVHCCERTVQRLVLLIQMMQVGARVGDRLHLWIDRPIVVDVLGLLDLENTLEPLGNTPNALFFFIFLGGGVYWMFVQRKLNKKAESDPDQIK